MALGTPVAGAAAYSASAGTTVAPAYPTGILATDAVLLFVGQKPSTANGGTVTTPSGWTLREELTGAGGYGTTLGADTGNTNLRVYSWNTPVAGQTGNLTVTIGVNNVSWAFIVRIPTGGGALSYGSADGQRTTTPTSPMSIALTNGATATNFEAGDKAIWAMCIPTDVTTPAQFSAQSITATGAVFATATELNEPDSTTGNDIGGYSAYAHVNSGSSTTAPTVTATLAGTLTNVRGPVVLVRLREAAPPARTGTLAATETGADTFAATGDVHVKGSLAASETGADTFAATGSVGSAAITGTLAATETGADTLASTGKVIVSGSLAVSEIGQDTFAATGKVPVQGSFSQSETGADTLAAPGKVLVKGAFSAAETGSDALVGSTGKVLVKGAMAVAETGADTFAASGDVIVRGVLAATETGADTIAATGDVIVQGALAATETGADVFFGNGTSQITSAGTLAATETGNDTASATGKVLVRGALAASETGDDTFASTGKVLVRGALAATESGADTFAATGKVVVAGAFAASETGTDTLAGTGKVLVRGDLGASETGSDTFAGGGGAVIVGTLAATEQDADSFTASGTIAQPDPSGTLAATEAADSFGGYAAGYVQPGYVGGVNGTVGATFALTGAQALLLRRLHQLHGLAAPLVVGPTSRSAGDLQQTVNESSTGSVTVTTTGGNDTFAGSVGQMIEELAALHGLTAPLVVTPTGRTAGAIVQAFSTSGNTTTVTRQ